MRRVDTAARVQGPVRRRGQASSGTWHTSVPTEDTPQQRVGGRGSPEAETHGKMPDFWVPVGDGE